MGRDRNGSCLKWAISSGYSSLILENAVSFGTFEDCFVNSTELIT